MNRSPSRYTRLGCPEASRGNLRNVVPAVVSDPRCVLAQRAGDLLLPRLGRLRLFTLLRRSHVLRIFRVVIFRDLSCDVSDAVDLVETDLVRLGAFFVVQ